MQKSKKMNWNQKEFRYVIKKKFNIQLQKYFQYEHLNYTSFCDIQNQFKVLDDINEGFYKNPSVHFIYYNFFKKITHHHLILSQKMR